MNYHESWSCQVHPEEHPWADVLDDVNPEDYGDIDPEPDFSPGYPEIA